MDTRAGAAQPQVFDGETASPVYDAPVHYMQPNAAATAMPGPLNSAFSLTDFANELTFITGLNGDNTVASTAFWTWNRDTPPTYKATSEASKWGAGSAGLATVGTAGGVVYYYFDPAANWTTAEKSEFTQGFALWNALANINWTQTSLAQAAAIVIYRGTDGQAHETDTPAFIATGSSSVLQKTTGNISIDTSAAPSFGPLDDTFSTFGGYPFSNVVHEEGHAMGLGHGGPYNAIGIAAAQQFTQYDTRLWSIMSYNNPENTALPNYVAGTFWGSGSNPGGTPDTFYRAPATPMILDILAVQQYYGAPTSTPFSGGQVFGFNTNLTGEVKPFYDFTVNTAPIVTIWDSGLNNTLDLSGFGSNSYIDLHAGAFSSAGFDPYSGRALTQNIAIALDTHINAAVGGPGGDTFVANDDGDVLTGNAGSDTFRLGAGNDTVYGGADSDTVVFGEAYAQVTITHNADGSLTVSGPMGVDKVYNVEHLVFTDVTGDSVPVVATSSGTTTASENQPIVIDAALTVQDTATTAITGARVAITAGFAAGEDTLVFTSQSGITGSYSATTGVLSLSGTASIAAYQTALRSVRFWDTSYNPSTAARTIGFTAIDGGIASPVASKSLSLTSVNNNPDIQTPNHLDVTEGMTISLTGRGFHVSDPDGGSGIETLTFAPGTSSNNSVTVAAGNSGVTTDIDYYYNTVSINGTLAQLNYLLSGASSGTLSFTWRDLAPTATYNLRVSIDDNGNTGSGSSFAVGTNVPVYVTPVNDAPSISGHSGGYAATLGQALHLVDASYVVTDVDGGSGQEELILQVGEGRLDVSPGTLGVQVTYSGGPTVYVFGSTAQLQALMRGESGASVDFFDASSSAASTTLTLTINDQGLGGPTPPSGALTSTLTRTVTLAPPTVTNHPPTLSAGAASVGLVEASPTSSGVGVAGVQLTASDPDGTTPTFVTSGLTSVGGTLYRVQGTYGVATLNTANSVVTYTLDNHAAATLGLAPGAQATDSFPFTVTDGSLTGSATAVFQVAGSAQDAVGSAGPDTFTSTGAANHIDGAGGVDTMVYSGPRSAYAVVRTASGVVQVADTRSGSPDGTDTLVNVERLQFSDYARSALLTLGSDYDGAGRGDLLFRDVNSGGMVAWDGADGAAGTVFGGVGTEWSIVTGDLDGDGRTDIVFRNTGSGQNVVWNGGLSSTAHALTAVDPVWKLLFTGDFDGDGKADLFFRNDSSGAMVIWRGGDSGNAAYLGGVGPEWQIKAGDFDGDGRTDLIFRNTSGGNVVWSGGDASAARVLTAVDPVWSLAATGDFDGDGKADLAFLNTSTGAVVTWSAADSSQAVFRGVTAADAQVLAGDFNGDGVSDLFVRNPNTGTLVIWDSAASSTAHTIGGVGSEWQIFG